MKECPKCGRKAAVNFDRCIYCGAKFENGEVVRMNLFPESPKKEPKKHYYQERRKLSKRAAFSIAALGSVVVLLIIILLIDLNGGFDFLKKPKNLSETDQMYYELSQIQAAMVRARLDLTAYPNMTVLIESLYLRGVDVVTYTSSTIVTEAARYQMLGIGGADVYSIYAETNSGSVSLTIDQNSPDAKSRMTAGAL